LMVLILIYRQQWNARAFKQLSWPDWLSLTGVALLEGAIAPALIFTALDLTRVNNVILIGRIEPALTLALSVLWLRERVNLWVVAGAIASFIGVFLTIVLQPLGEDGIKMMGFQIGIGELMTVGWAVAIALSTIISKAKLRNIPLGIFTIYRTALGTLVFFVVAIKLYGSVHFIDAFSPLLWQWMLFYGAVIVAGGQFCFFNGLKKTTASEVSLVSSFSPIVGIVAAYLILGEAPNMAQYIGGTIILLGIALNQIGATPKSAEIAAESGSAKEMEMEAGFKGI
ncbi:MAG: DMT family transporter, partial [Coleofasciculus sp. S288]|nr:DMT family transporter [Coleofasciculus sp. S288]